MDVVMYHVVMYHVVMYHVVMIHNGAGGDGCHFTIS
jgi:hypothetical protein